MKNDDLTIFLKSEYKQERFQSLKFHYDELMQQHNLCLECMEKQKNDMEHLKAENNSLIVMSK